LTATDRVDAKVYIRVVLNLCAFDTGPETSKSSKSVRPVTPPQFMVREALFQ